MPNDENHLRSIRNGTFFGTLAGGGPGACVFNFYKTPLFTGDTILIVAAICGILGCFFAKRFSEYCKENWWIFG